MAGGTWDWDSFWQEVNVSSYFLGDQSLCSDRLA
jgi:hypothetical protein